MISELITTIKKDRIGIVKEWHNAVDPTNTEGEVPPLGPMHRFISSRL